MDIDAQNSKKKVEFEVELQDISSKQPEQVEEQEGNEDVQNTDGQDVDHVPIESDYMLVRDRTRREIRAPQRHCYADLIAYAFLVVKDLRFDEPSSYKEEISCKDANLWKVAMQKEMKSLNKNKTWILVDKPKDGKMVGCKWIFKRKEGILGKEPARYKARLVAKGFTQR